MNNKRLIKFATFVVVGVAFLLVPSSSRKQADRLPDDDKKKDDKEKGDTK